MVLDIAQLKEKTKEDLIKELKVLRAQLALQEELEESRKKAEDAQSQLKSIVDYSIDAIIGTTLDGTIFTWNPGAERLYGYSASEVMGKTVAFLFPPERKNEMPEIIEKIKSGKLIEQFETIRVRKDGKQIHVSSDIAPIRNSNGTIVGISAIVRDMTEQRKLQAELQKAKQKEAQEKELHTIEQLANSPQIDIMSQLFGFNSLKDSFPEVFNEMVKRYEDLIKLALDEDESKNDDDISQELHFIGKQLGFLKAGPSDVLEIHTATLKRSSKNVQTSKSQAYSEIGRRMCIELMGHLASYYRNMSMSVRKINLFDALKDKK